MNIIRKNSRWLQSKENDVNHNNIIPGFLDQEVAPAPSYGHWFVSLVNYINMGDLKIPWHKPFQNPYKALTSSQVSPSGQTFLYNKIKFDKEF